MATARPMRDAIAALLVMRGYTHDASDEHDLYWYGDTLGVRPMLACVAHEMNRDLASGDKPFCSYADRYEVAIAHV